METQDPLVQSVPSLGKERVIKKSLPVLSILLLKTKREQTYTTKVKNGSRVSSICKNAANTRVGKTPTGKHPSARHWVRAGDPDV